MDNHKKIEHVIDNSTIKFCPFRTYTETKPSMMKGGSDLVVTRFMPCLHYECPAYHFEPGFARCKRLDQ